ncbi:MAG: phosphotransferase family protein [Microscillaceae bacterium]|jgi:aminoglycoside phosphotransferase (APT) family kinase protein|nr:phosphotransferase family protein [Microscillaceae bacterium]
MLDEAQKQIRQGEELDLSSLNTYLNQYFQSTEALEILQFPGGHSNLTYLLRYGNRQLVLRKPPGGAKHIKGGHDMKREYRVLSLLIQAYPKVPQVVLFCEDESIIGTEFYLMERIEGVVLRSKKPSGIELSPDFMRHLSLTFVDNFIELQSVNVFDSQLINLGKPEGYVLRQVEGSLQRYQNVATEPIAEVNQVADWLKAHLPNETRVSIIHNDYKFDNVIYSPDFQEIRGVLDWEMSTIGDPFADLGMVLGYWLEPGEPNLLGTWATSLAGAFTRQELLEYYEQKRQLKVHNPVFYYALSLFKNAVVAQQLYYRFAQGFTQDERLGRIGPFVRGAFEYAWQVIRAGRLSKL